MNVYCGGDKGAMKSMIETIQRGEEEDEELLERFGKMRAYLEKRDEQAGDWVFEVRPLFLPLLSTSTPGFSHPLTTLPPRFPRLDIYIVYSSPLHA